MQSQRESMAANHGDGRGAQDCFDVRCLRNAAYDPVLLTRRLCDEARRRYSVREIPKQLAEALRGMIVISDEFRRRADEVIDTLAPWR